MVRRHVLNADVSRRAVVVLAAIALHAAPAGAAAPFAPGATVVSANGSELSDRKSFAPLLSGDGRYVVFRANASVLLGRAANPDEVYADGFVRKDLETGALDLVATPQRVDRETFDVVSPGVADTVAGISDDGRYVLLVSRAPLVDSVQSTVTPQVYVRDMTRPRNDPSGYELVSAEDGSDRPALYADPRAGSSPGVLGFSLSDDGRRAVFVTQTASSLPGEPAATTPRWQIFVRDLDARTTRLVTRDRSDPTLPGTPVAPDRGTERAPLVLLSGDGSAVAWAGSNADRQARFLPGDQPGTTADLLWRDLDAGPAAPTRRIAGAADPEDPGCPADAVFVPSETATGPCYGPFAAPEETGTKEDSVPQLGGISDDGRFVLFSGGSKLRPYANTQRQAAGFLADMASASRKQGVTVAWSQRDTQAEIRPDSVLAGDGRHAVFASVGAEYDGLQPVGTFPGGTLTTFNAFAVDLTTRTVERATVAPDGGDYQTAQTGTALSSLTISDDGSAIAFAAEDGNLFVGDVNGMVDVQLVRRSLLSDEDLARRRELPPPPAPPTVLEPPLTPLPPVHAVIGRVQVDRRGVATVLVRVPAAGRVSANAVARSVRTGGRGAARKGDVRVGADRREVRRPRNVLLRVAPSKAARQALRSDPRGRISVQLSIRYAATKTGASRSDQTYVLTSRAVVRRQDRPVARGQRRASGDRARGDRARGGSGRRSGR